MIHSWARGPKAPANPWRSLTLEWQVSSPAPIFNFDEPPQVVGSPYAYGIPGARHAIVTWHTPQPVERRVPVALAVGSPAQREAIMSSLKHILVVANQTVASDPLIAAVRARAQAEPVTRHRHLPAERSQRSVGRRLRTRSPERRSAGSTPRCPR